MRTKITINGRTYAISSEHAEGASHNAMPGRPISKGLETLRRLNHMRGVVAEQAAQRGVSLPGLRQASVPMTSLAVRLVQSAQPNRTGLVAHLGGAR